MARRRLRLRIVGRVQGVGFRYHVEEVAQRYGVTGFVRNCADGAVEVVAEGDPEVLEAFAAETARGPRASRVDRLEREEGPATGEFRGFTIRF